MIKVEVIVVEEKVEQFEKYMLLTGMDWEIRNELIHSYVIKFNPKNNLHIKHSDYIDKNFNWKSWHPF